MFASFSRLWSSRRPAARRPRTTLSVTGLEDRTVMTAAPTGLAVWHGYMDGQSVVPASWQPVAGADEYRLEARRDGGDWRPVPALSGSWGYFGGVTRLTSSIFVPGASGYYSFRVRAVDDGVVSAPSLTASTTTFLFPLPGDPTRLLPDYAVTTPGTAVAVPVLTNDRAPAGATLSLFSVSQPANGTAVIAGDQVRYTPKPGFAGSDSFYYTVAITATYRATSLVTVDVAAAAPADRPVVSVRAVTPTIREPNLGATGTPGRFQFTRTGDLSKPLTVAVGWGGTARFNADYEPLKWTVTFAAGKATADVLVVPKADIWRDGTEDVTAQVRSGAGYAVSTTRSVAAIDITDTYNPRLTDPTIR